MKQLVLEKWNGQNVKFDLSYPKESKFFSLKEREEKTFYKNGKKFVVYWIRVANDPVNCEDNTIKYVRPTTWEKKNVKLTELRRKRDERISRMKKVVEEATKSGEEFSFSFSSQDISDGMNLMEMITRKKKQL